MKQRVTRSIVPNLLTLVNLFAGFTAIVHISSGNIERAVVFIVIAAIFDMIDGVTARLFGATSEFGAELDSLCDVVSFGVAPGYMLYKVFFFQYGEMGLLISALPALAGAVRLARFNVKLSSYEDKLYFHGLPIPSSAITIISYVLFYHSSNIIPEQYKASAIIFVTLLVSVTMVSKIRFDNLPRPTARSFKQRPFVFIIFTISLAASIITGGRFVFPFFMFYILASTVREFILWLRERREPEDELDQTEEAETSFLDED